MDKPIRVLTLTCGETELVEQTLPDSYQAIRTVVRGFMERVQLFQNGSRSVDVWLNEEGKIYNLPINAGLIVPDDTKQEFVFQDTLHGNIVIAASDRFGNTVGLKDKEIEQIKERFFVSANITPQLGNKAFYLGDERGIEPLKSLLWVK